MYNIPVNASIEQMEILNKYIGNKDINLSEELLIKAMELIEDYEDTQKALESMEKSENKKTYSIEDMCKKYGINYDEL